MVWFKRYKIKKITKKLKAMQNHRQLNPSSDDLIAKEIKLYLTLASLYQSFKHQKNFDGAGM